MWRTVKLGEVCEIQPKKAQVKKKLADTDAVSFMPMEDLGIDKMHPTANQNKTLAKAYGSYTYFEDNDILLAKITPCFENGKLGIASNLTNGVGFGSSEYIVLRCHEEVLPQYIYYHLSRPSFRAEGKAQMSGAVGHKRVPKEFVENLELPLPPLSDQHRIVAKLDAAFAEIDRAIEATHEQLKSSSSIALAWLKTKFAQDDAVSKTLSLCVGMPTTKPKDGWEWHKLTDIAKLESGHTPSRRHPEYWGGDIKWVGIKDARKHHTGVIFDTEQQTNELGIKNSSARLLPKDTVCLSRTASVGYVFRLGESMATSQDFINWVCTPSLQPEFLQLLFLAEGEAIKRFGSGAIHKTIYFDTAKEFHVCIPSLKRQHEIVSAYTPLIENANKVIEFTGEKGVALTSLKSAILAQELQPQQSEAA